ncbi:Glycerol-3-phosphate cytidylyltransferase [compost metagenome]|uniref:adenylyltransferase/cytidyltransferase family protein n=1 Tax=Pseudomonas TaxID=286 RepID=UPI000D347181|nr:MULTISPECIES: adenylyltransferase/cytidyltransferase family protein [Pseudomonas]MCX2708748.1 adenylyltransferase/cytidyltransferase family protein [Pseudomonas sp. DCB_BG]PTV66859.1 glycerol-3-phosphate cytidylyltransferase [Pseudomonas putida]WJD64067.1 adenylyltransferase/cytidyltransferase family protein [Pseudomonas kurunegalensis]
MKRIITFGTFDVLHVGHIRILQRAKALGHHLTVGVSSDALNFSKKKRNPVYPETDRSELISSLKFVDHVFIEESLELKAEYIKEHKADILVMGDDWEGKFDFLSPLCEVKYLRRTEGISTTQLIAEIRKYE